MSGDGHIQVDAQYTNNINVHPIRRGVIKDWDQLETVWQNITEITNLTQIDSTSIFIVESPRMNGVDRSKWAELLFETYRASSICLSNSCALTLFASGRTTGVAVECGAGITTSMPVFEGLSLRHAGVFTDYGGQDISFMLKHMLAERGIFIDLMSAKTIKEQLAYANGFQSSRHTPLEQSTTYFLPDGTDVSIDAPTLGACTEKLFNSKENSSLGLVNQVRESITLCDESVKKDLIENIIISGGTSMLPGKK